jgi:hypothetical protein
MYHPFIFPFSYSLASHYDSMSIKGSIGLFVRHNNREESYLVPEELVSHIAISISCLVIFFDFTTRYQHEALVNCCVLLIFNIKSHS